MIDNKIRNISKHDGERHYRNGIPHQQKNETPPSPLLKKMLGLKEKKIDLFSLPDEKRKPTYDEFVIFVRKHFRIVL